MAQDYTNMSVQDKLKLADERLEKLKGTDKYDAFKKRVDAINRWATKGGLLMARKTEMLEGASRMRAEEGGL